MPLSFRKQVIIGFASTALLLMGLGIFQYSSFVALIRTANGRAQNSQVLNLIEEEFSLLRDIEAAHRGFIITRDSRFLENYNDHARLLAENFKSLRALTRKNRQQQLRIRRFQDLAEQKSALSQQLIELRQRQGLAVVTQVMQKGAGFHLMEEIRQEVSRIKTVENRLLKASEQEMLHRAQYNLNLLLTVGLFDLILLVLIFILVYQEIASREAAEAELKRVNDNLNALVAEQTVAIAEERERFSRVIQGSNDAFWEWDLRSGELYLSDRFYQMLGITRNGEKLTYEAFDSLLDEPDRLSVRLNLESAIQEHRPYQAALKIKTSSNEYIDCLFRGKPDYDEAGKSIRLSGMISDISEENRIKEALKESDARFRQVLASNIIGIVFWNIYGKIYEANDAFLKLLGYSHEELEEGKLNWRNITVSSEQKAHAERVQSAIAGKTVAPYETQYICKDGHQIDVLVGYAMLENSREQGFSFVLDISERKRMEDALRRSEAKFRRLVEANVLGIAFWEMDDQAGAITDANDTFLYMLGYQRKTDLEKTLYWQDLIIEEDLVYHRQAMTQALEGQQIAPYEIRFRHQLGHLVYILTGCAVLEGLKAQGISFLVDITSRKAAETALVESEARFRAMAEQAPIMIWMTDDQGNIEYINKYWSDLTGRMLEITLETGWFEAVFEADRKSAFRIFRRAIKDQHLYDDQFRVMGVNDELRWVRASGVPRYTSIGDYIGFVGTIVDVTEQKKIKEDLEAKVRQRTLELQKSSQMLYTVIENVPDMIFMKDARDLRFELFNRAGQELTGYSKEDFLGKTDYDFFSQEQADQFIHKDRETLSRKVLINIPEEFLQTKSGEIRTLHTRKVPILDEKGEPIYLLGISEDITDAKNAQEKIEILNEQLQAQVQHLNSLNKELEAFSYSVSHDLRTPLRSIDGFSQAILEDCGAQLDETGKRYLSRVQEGSRQMAQLIEDMLTLSRLTRGEVKKESTNLSDLVFGIVHELQAQQPERQVAFKIQEGVIAEADKRLMQIVFHNLLENAWKFTSQESNAIIAFGVLDQADPFAKGKQTVFYVRDNGAGFNMAYADKLFGAFNRLHNISEFEGTGIGLATVQRVIHRHGGEVWAQGQVGMGATFYFTLG